MPMKCRNVCSGLVVITVALALVACGGSQNLTDALTDDTADIVGDIAADATADSVADTVADVTADIAADIAGDTTPDITPDTTTDTTVPPTYWTAEATQTLDDLNFVQVDGKPVFAIGFDTNGGLIYDGVTDPAECDAATMKGWLDLNVEKNQLAAAAGANFAYVWGYDGKDETLVDVDPPFYGIFQGNYGATPDPEKDVIPIIYNAFGEEDMDDRTEANAQRMHGEFEAFAARTGKYSTDAIPNLPAYEELPWFSWHPTSRMRGNGTNTTENLTTERATMFAQTTNMMIGDFYTYTTNRFDLSTEQGQWDAIIYRQIGDIDEGYDYWLSIDEEAHRDHFSSGWDLAHSLVMKRNADAVVWMWLQGYAFTYGINKSLCESGASDAGKKGDFPPDRYIRKDITSVIAAGATGIIFFGFHMVLMPETEILLKYFRALSDAAIYEPALTSPRLKLDADTTNIGESIAGDLPVPVDGLQGAAHAIVKWHEATKTAYIIASNPGPRATTITLTFPWTLADASLYDWYNPEFKADAGIAISDRTITYTIPLDDGVIIKVTPLMPPAI
jgi:hypothetical protein